MLVIVSVAQWILPHELPYFVLRYEAQTGAGEISPGFDSTNTSQVSVRRCCSYTLTRTYQLKYARSFVFRAISHSRNDQNFVISRGTMLRLGPCIGNALKMNRTPYFLLSLYTTDTWQKDDSN